MTRVAHMTGRALRHAAGPALILTVAALGGTAADELRRPPAPAAAERHAASCAHASVLRAGYLTAFTNGDVRVRAVRVSGLPAACEGQTVAVTLTHAGRPAGTGTATITNATHTVALHPTPAAATVSGVHVQVFDR